MPLTHPLPLSNSSLIKIIKTPKEWSLNSLFPAWCPVVSSYCKTNFLDHPCLFWNCFLMVLFREFYKWEEKIWDSQGLDSVKKANFVSLVSSVLSCFHFVLQDIFTFKPHQLQWKKKKELCVRYLARFNFLPVSAESLQHNEKIWNTNKGKEMTQSLHHSMNQRDFVMY